MKVSTILDHIDRSHMALPELQREAGFRCFTTEAHFRDYVSKEILAVAEAAA